MFHFAFVFICALSLRWLMMHCDCVCICITFQFLWTEERKLQSHIKWLTITNTNVNLNAIAVTKLCANWNVNLFTIPQKKNGVAVGNCDKQTIDLVHTISEKRVYVSKRRKMIRVWKWANKIHLHYHSQSRCVEHDNIQCEWWMQASWIFHKIPMFIRKWNANIVNLLLQFFIGNNFSIECCFSR